MYKNLEQPQDQPDLAASRWLDCKESSFGQMAVVGNVAAEVVVSNVEDKQADRAA